VLIASSEGGVNIEEIAERNPDAIIKIPVDIHEGFNIEKGKMAAEKMGIPAKRFFFNLVLRLCVKNHLAERRLANRV
jgi:succinyl-CoA synthetase beta subunit